MDNLVIAGRRKCFHRLFIFLPLTLNCAWWNDGFLLTKVNPKYLIIWLTGSHKIGHCFGRCLILWCNFLWEVSGEGRRLWYKSQPELHFDNWSFGSGAVFGGYGPLQGKWEVRWLQSDYYQMSQGISQEALCQHCAETQWTGQDWMDWTDLDHWTKLDDSTELDWTGLIWTEWTYWTDFDWRALTGVDWTWLTGLDWLDRTESTHLTRLDWLGRSNWVVLNWTGLDMIGLSGQKVLNRTVLD